MQGITINTNRTNEYLWSFTESPTRTLKLNVHIYKLYLNSGLTGNGI